ncbi:MAG: hypothetical protein Q8O37_06965, partial [Sulfuricellaceae bacterium]|nr:hypothetical protein [Sulfuricellaceae bacterium]
HQSRQTKSPWRETKNEQIQSPKTRRSDQYALRANASNFIYLNSIGVKTVIGRQREKPRLPDFPVAA